MFSVITNPCCSPPTPCPSFRKTSASSAWCGSKVPNLTGNAFHSQSVHQKLVSLAVFVLASPVTTKVSYWAKQFAPVQ